jgi:hypothetical protein
MNMSDRKFAIMNRTYKTFLDDYECEVCSPLNALLFDSFDMAKYTLDNIDVAYLYEIVEVEINYIIKEFGI